MTSNLWRHYFAWKESISMRKCKIYRFSIFNLNFARALLAVTVSTFYLVFRFDGNDDVGSFSISLLSLTNPHLNCVLSNSVESVQSLLLWLVVVVCPAEVNLSCFDQSVVTLLRASVTPPPLPPIFYSRSFLFTLASRVTANIVFLVRTLLLCKA